jgi:two-component system chemotaxis response regulator CheY
MFAERSGLAQENTKSQGTGGGNKLDVVAIDPAARLVPAGSAPRLKVLIVEDDLTSRLTLQSLLHEYGECHVAVNGKEAIEAFAAARQAGKGYDLICLDIKMPEMDGQTALKSIREIEMKQGIFRDRVRIFMTTGAMDIKTIRASFDSICDAYIIKPIDGTKLDAQLRSFHLIPPK